MRKVDKMVSILGNQNAITPGVEIWYPNFFFQKKEKSESVTYSQLL